MKQFMRGTPGLRIWCAVAGLAVAAWTGSVEHAHASASAEACAGYGDSNDDPCGQGAHDSNTGLNSASAQAVNHTAVASASISTDGSLSLQGTGPQSGYGEPFGITYTQAGIGDDLQFSRYFGGVLTPLSDFNPTKLIISDPNVTFDVPEGDAADYSMTLRTSDNSWNHYFNEVQYAYSALPTISSSSGDTYSYDNDVFTVDLTKSPLPSGEITLSIAANLTAGGAPVATVSDPPTFEFLDSSGNPISGVVITSSSGFDWAVAPAPASGAPEGSTWMLMIAGLGLTGAAFRFARRRGAAVAAAGSV